MEAGSAQQPLKICRHCSVASRTDAGECPSCGRPYRRARWRWWMAIPIVALAFAGGFFGRKALTDDEQPSTITRQEGEAIELGISTAELEGALGEPPRFTQTRGKGEAELACSYYAIEDEPEAGWEFCFHQGALVTSQPAEVD